LATHAQGLLIWAATVCSLVSHKFDERRPHEILERILRSEEKVGAQSGKQLERLYHGAISTLFPEDMREKLRNFFGAMMVLQESLPIRDFACLLGMPVHLAEEIQQQLAALQTRGEFKSSIVPPAIQHFHFSFLEFMESPLTECNGQPLAINTANAHSMLANRCFEIVFSESLPSYRGTTIGYSELRGVELYAIKFWPLHLSNGRTSRLPRPSSSTAKDPMDMISEHDMRRWATLFLPCVAARFEDSHGYDSLDNTPRSSLPYQLATIIGKNGVTMLSHQLHCLLALDIPAMFMQSVGTSQCHPCRNIDWLESHSNLDEEISILRRALLQPAPYPDRSMSLNNLASALQTRFQRRGVSSDLNEAILFHHEALLLRPAPRPDRPRLLNCIANALRIRFQHLGACFDLDEGISCQREALLLQPVPHPDRSISLDGLAIALFTRFQHRGVYSDLDEAISFNHEAFLRRPNCTRLLDGLACALQIRFQHRGVSSDLDEAISFQQKALLLQPAPHADRSISLDGLANALQTRFQHLGVSSDLDEAILFQKEALLLQPAPHPHCSRLLDGLASSLFTRFQHRGVSSDLDDAILFHRKALLLRPAPHPDHSMLLNNLATALFTRFQHRGILSDLEEAILLHQEALSLRPAPHPARSILLNNLASALQTRFEMQGTVIDRDDANLLRQEAETLVL
jgi:tetratricopeptide (TPR) repeat protein